MFELEDEFQNKSVNINLEVDLCSVLDDKLRWWTVWKKNKIKIIIKIY